MSNVSRSGLLVTLPESVQTGTTLIVSFIGRRHLNARYAVVVRDESATGYHIVGLKFEVCPAALSATLEREHRMAHGTGLDSATGAA
jgi:hypothetical protein